MTRTLGSYLRRRVGTQILALLLLIVAIVQLLELLDVTTEILKRGQGLAGLLHYGLLRLPGELVFALPLAALLGTMLSLSAMARGLEIAAIRTAGISIARLFGYLLPLLVLLAVLQFALSEQVLPRAETALKAWWSASERPDADPKRLWTRTDSGLVSIGSASPDGSQLKAVRVYHRDATGRLVSRWSAAQARWNGRGWQLSDVTELRMLADDGIERTHADSREWTTNLRPDDVLRIDDARPQLSSIMLAEVIAGSRAGTQSRSYYETVLYRSFTAPLGVIVMSLLALPTACAMPRSGKGREMVAALVLGLGFLLCDGIAASFGTSGQLAPLVTAVIAPVLFAAIGLLQMRACERA